MEVHVPSRLLSAFTSPLSLSRGLAGKGPGWAGLGRAGGLPAARSGRVPRKDQSSDPDWTQRWSSGRQPSRRRPPGTLPAAARAPGLCSPAEAGPAGGLVTCGREGRWRPGVCRNVVTCRGKFPSAAGRGSGAGGRAEEGRAERRRSREPLGRVLLSTLVLASEASFCLSQAQPPPGKRKGGRKEQEKEIREKGGGERQLAARDPSRG